MGKVRHMFRTFGPAWALFAGLALAAALAAQGGNAPPKLKKLDIKDLKPGKGPAAADGDTVYVTYSGALFNGKIFDRNDRPGDAPYVFVLGANPPMVIKGWDLGLRGMKVGGVRVLGIPASLGYGARASGDIPPNSDLFFQITLLDVIKKGDENVYDSVDLKVGTGRPAKKGDKLLVHYTGKLVNGKLIDDTRAPNRKAVEFVLGSNRVLRGVNAGLVGMKAGGKRKLRIPPNLAYGTGGTAQIPPGSILIYEFELLKVIPG